MEDQAVTTPPAAPEPPTPRSAPDTDTTALPPNSNSSPEPTPPITLPDTPSSEVLPEPQIPTGPLPFPTETPPSVPAPEPSPAAPSPEPTPQTVTPPPDPVPSPPIASEPNQPPALPSQPSSTDIVASLTDAQLKAAAALYARKHQAELSRAGVRKRQAVAEQNITAILDFVSSHSPASNRTIARALNLPPRRVQHYMQLLTHRGDITATGWGASREYRIK